MSLGRTDLNNVPVGLIMTRVSQVITASPEESVFTAAQRLTVYQVEALPVVRKKAAPNDRGEKQELIGRITRSRITKLFSELGEKKSTKGGDDVLKRNDQWFSSSRIHWGGRRQN